jgi:hypothetical protein
MPRSSTTLTTRIPHAVAHGIRQAAHADGITVSAWLALRARNSLRRTRRETPAVWDATTSLIIDSMQIEIDRLRDAQ